MPINLFPSTCPNPITALSFDYGTERIGVAFGQSISATAKAVAVLDAKNGVPDWGQVKKLLEEWKPDCCVVGLPYNMDGSSSELLNRAIKFANRVSGRFKIDCYGIDERLSSKAAINQIINSQESRKKKPIDGVAAQIILESWFNEYNLQ